LNKQTKKQRKK